jgi:hypothetical protein
MNQAEATNRAIRAVEKIAFDYADEVMKEAPKGADRMDVSKIVVLASSCVLLSIALTGHEFGVFLGQDGEEIDRVGLINLSLKGNGVPYRLVPLQ